MSRCECCGIEANERLCADCNMLLEEGYVNNCECGKYKKSEYELCSACYNKRKPYKDLTGENKVPEKKKKAGSKK